MICTIDKDILLKGKDTSIRIHKENLRYTYINRYKISIMIALCGHICDRFEGVCCVCDPNTRLACKICGDR